MKIIVLGCGAIGSNLSAYLVSDIRDDHEITVLDCDAVEERNIRAGTQFYTRDQIAIPKTEALQYNIYKHLNRTVKTYTTAILFTNAERIVKEFNLVIDCFDNHESRSAITEACKGIPCVHVGFSPNFTWSVLWNDGYVPPEDAPKDFDICTLEGASSFVHMVSSIGSLVVQDFLATGKKREFVGNKLLVREVL
jgi:hypothetical protein